MVWVGDVNERGVAGDQVFAISCALLHAVADELTRSSDPARRDRAVRIVELFPLPAALFGGVSGSEPIANAAWRSMFADALPAKLAGSIETVSGAHTVEYLEELEVPISGYTGYISMTLQSLLAAPGALVVGIEVTDRVLARRLRVNEQALIWCVPASGEPSYCNERWRSLIGTDWKEAVHVGDLRRWSAALGEAERQREPAEIDLRLRMADETYRWHRVRFAAGTDHVACSATDIHVERGHETERNELLAQARSAHADAERANRLKDEFLAAVSHELRAPLTTMLLWEKVLREHSNDDQSRGQALDAIHQSAVAQARLVADLLDFARGISGKLYLDIRAVDVTQVVADAIAAARPGAYAKSINLESDFAPLAGGVHADATRLRQILDNLLSNAIKFTSPGGTVTLSVTGSGRFVTIAVEDSGRGIAPESLTRIFEPFSQVDDALTRREGGLGLGLTISKQLVELHRGTLIATSRGLGHGAKFTLTLPMAGTPRAPSPPVGVRRVPRLDGARVLVIDDDVRVRDALAVLLGRAGLHVDTADSAANGRARIADSTPHAVICDIAMPGEDGYSFVRKLRASGCTVPSVALTAYSTQLDAQRALEAGFDLHLAKPINLERLVDALSELLAEQRSQRIT